MQLTGVLQQASVYSFYKSINVSRSLALYLFSSLSLPRNYVLLRLPPVAQPLRRCFCARGDPTLTSTSWNAQPNSETVELNCHTFQRLSEAAHLIAWREIFPTIRATGLSSGHCGRGLRSSAGVGLVCVHSHFLPSPARRSLPWAS